MVGTDSVLETMTVINGELQLKQISDFFELLPSPRISEAGLKGLQTDVPFAND